MRIYYTHLFVKFSTVFWASLIALVVLTNSPAQSQTVWLHLERLPESLIKIYGKDSLTQLLSQQIAAKQRAFTLMHYGYQDDIRLATLPINPAYQKDFNLRLWLYDTVIRFENLVYAKYALYEKDSLSNSSQLPLQFEEATAAKTLGFITGLARVVMSRSVSKKVNTFTQNWRPPQIDSLRIAQKRFYYVVVEYKSGKQIPKADKQLIWNMIQNQWNQTQANLKYRFQEYFNLYFWQAYTPKKDKKQLLKKLPNYIKITYHLEELPKGQSYRVTPKVELKNVPMQVHIKAHTVRRQALDTYPYKTLGSIAWAYLTMKDLFEL